MNKHIAKRILSSAMALLLVVTMLAPVSALAETNHQHDESCYTYEKELSCDIPESEGHTHNEGCYCPGGENICGVEESDGHTHGDSCYAPADEVSDAAESELICGLEESEGHTHTDDCICPGGELTCETEESQGHIHNDACYTEVKKLTCSLSESPDGVAMIGTTSYATLQDAVDSVQSGETIRLLCDFTIDKQVNIYRAVDFTLDMNGKTITATQNCRYALEFYNMEGPSNVVITGEGTINAVYVCIDAYDSFLNLTIESGTFNSLENNALYVTENANVSIQQGVFTSESASNGAVCIFDDNCLKVNEATFENPNAPAIELGDNKTSILEVPLGSKVVPADWKDTNATKVTISKFEVEITYYAEGNIYTVQSGNLTELFLPEPPIHSGGYNFCYWADTSGSPVYDFSNITEDTSLYATFTDTKFTVTFEDQGTQHTETVVAGTPLGAVPGIGRTEAGDNFYCWMLDNEVVNTDTEIPVTSDITLIARYGNIVTTYQELVDALTAKQEIICLGADILVEDTITVDYNCRIYSKDQRYGFIRPDNNLDLLLFVGDEDNNAHIALALENILVDGKNIDANNSGIEIGNNVSLKATNCIFRNNRCTDYWNDDGGMIYSEDAEYVDLEFTNCKLSGNYALGDGGAIYLAEGGNNTLLLRNCCVTENEAQGDYGGGGGIYFTDGICNIIDTEISNNTASSSGGGIYFDYSEMHLYGTTKVINNTADREGGGIYSGYVDEDGKQGLHLHDQTALLRNTAECGGGFSGLEMCLYVYDDVLIAENTASEDGGGIYSPDYLSCFYGGTVRDNHADGCGGGIYTTYYETYCYSGMIYDNTADKAGDDVYNEQADKFLLYNEQPRRLYNDGNSSELETVIVQQIDGYDNQPTTDIAVPFLGWFIDGQQEGWNGPFQNLYNGIENSILVSDENDNLGFLTGEYEKTGAKAIWYGYLLAYDANYDGGSYEYDDLAYLPDTDAVVSSNMFERAGYKFTGWNTQPDGSGISYQADEKIPMTESKILYAQWKPVLSITPANLTIYKGGNDGYDGTVDEEGNTTGSTSLPEPLFHITALDGADVADTIIFVSGEKQWTATKLTSTDNKTYYAITPAEGQDPVRVSIIGPDGEVHTSDEFDISNVHELYAEFDCKLYLNTVNPENVTATMNGEIYLVDSDGIGKLTVRTVEDTDDPITPVINIPPIEKLPSGTGVIYADSEIKYYVNNTGIEAPKDRVAPSLLFDTIANSDGIDRESALKERVDEVEGVVEEGKTRHYQAQYLDLVDANNGNLWLKASDEITVYWGYPEGTDMNTDFEMYHFTGLHRDNSGNANSGYALDDILQSPMEKVTFSKTNTGISFKIQPGGFSPFVLIWETDSSDGGNPNPPDTDTGDLTISKVVAGNAGETNKDFHFAVKLSDISVNATYGDITFVGGVATFTLKHGESKTATGLAAGISYEVTELEANQDYVRRTLEEGARKARETASVVLDRVRRAVGLA